MTDWQAGNTRVGEPDPRPVEDSPLASDDAGAPADAEEAAALPPSEPTAAPLGEPPAAEESAPESAPGPPAGTLDADADADAEDGLDPGASAGDGTSPTAPPLPSEGAPDESPSGLTSEVIESASAMSAALAPSPDVATAITAPSVDTAGEASAPRGAPPEADASSEEATVATPTHAELASARPLPRAIAIANQKGGVGKTTTAVNLGAGLAELGYRVLVVDLDPQGNATTGLGVNPRNIAGSVYDVLMSDAPLEDCVEPTAVRNLFVVPATIDLAGAEIELVPAFSRELKLRRAIDRLAGEFDFTLIDCPPSLGLLTVNGLAAAGEVLVPIQCEYYALEGLGQLIKNIQLVQSNLNPRLELSTIVLTMYDARTRLSDQVAKDVREHFGPKVCRTIVPRTVRLSEAPSFGQPINVFDPSSRGATAYRELAKEVSGGTARRSG